MRALLPALLILTALVVSGCAGTTSDTGAPTQPLDNGNAPATSTTTAPPAGGGKDHPVSISGFKFVPASLGIAVGDSVTWTNADSADHTATDSDDNGFDSGTIHGGATFTQAFTKAGTYSYHCKIHGSMTATITVA